jgi:hypothetical protein
MSHGLQVKGFNTPSQSLTECGCGQLTLLRVGIRATTERKLLNYGRPNPKGIPNPQESFPKIVRCIHSAVQIEEDVSVEC